LASSTVAGDERPALGPAVYARVLLKLSGEALLGERSYGIDPDRISSIARQVRETVDRGVEVSIVVGAGNIFRGVAGAARGMDRATADYMGMIATVLNALSIQDALEKLGVITRIQSAITMQEVAEPYIRRRAIRHLEKKRVVIFAGGTGNPFFTTDTTAALRALETGSECILMAKNAVEGVLDADPRVESDARLIPRISHMEAIERGLRVMDTTALTLCMDNDLPIHVFNMGDDRNVGRILSGQHVGTIVATDHGGEG
jgi:uridylate kinase